MSPPPLPLRLAILECDTPLTNTQARYGGYGGVFTALLHTGANSLAYPGLSSTSGLAISCFDVVTAQQYPSLEDIDAVLITGSRYNSFDDDEWILKLVAFTKTLLDQQRVRVVGVCFGHQIVGRALGAELGRCREGWEVSVTSVDLTNKGQEVFGVGALALNQMHRDVVFAYPPGVEELAYTQKCPVHGMYVPKHLLTVQGHPEFDEEITREILVSRHKMGILSDDVFEDAIARVDKHHDGVVVSQAFLRFLLE